MGVDAFIEELKRGFVGEHSSVQTMTFRTTSKIPLSILPPNRRAHRGRGFARLVQPVPQPLGDGPDGVGHHR